MSRLNTDNRSVFFLTFHKTASSLFANKVFPHINSLCPVDYAKLLFSNDASSGEVEVGFEEHGHLYGPVRLSLNEGVIYERLNLPLIESGLLYHSKLTVMVRDPRDILVSYYYSVVYSHVLSSNPDVRELQLKNRQHWKQRGLDEYVLEKSILLNTQFSQLINILENNPDTSICRYEDMIMDFDRFSSDITTYLPMEKEMLEFIYGETRPQVNKDIMRHKRSGKVGDHREELNELTIVRVTAELMSPLGYFGYSL